MGFVEFVTHFNSRRYAEALEAFVKIEESKTQEASIYKSRILLLIGKIREALILIDNTLDSLDENDDLELFVIARIFKSTILLRTHDNKVGLEYSIDTKRIVDNLQEDDQTRIKDWIGLLYRTIGVYYDFRGQLSLALEYYLTSLELEKSSGNTEFMGHSHNNIGEIYRAKGQLETALDHYQKSMELNRGNDIYWDLVLKNNISIIYFMQGKIEQAINLAAEVIEIGDSGIIEIEPYLRADTRYYLIVYYVSLGKYVDANSILKEISTLSKKYRIDFINELEKLAEAYILKSSIRMKDKTKAQLLFEELLEDRSNIRNYEVITTSLLSLCEILIFEFKVNNSTEVLREIKNHLEDLANIAAQNQSYALSVNTLGLQAKLAIIEGEFDKADTLFQQAILNSDEFSLTTHLELWEREHQEFINEIDKWKLLSEASSSINQRISESNFELYLENALKLAIGNK